MRPVRGHGRPPRSLTSAYKYLLANGTTGLSVAFDLPTQIGLDSDNALAMGEVGKVGVAIDSIEDMQSLFDGIDLNEDFYIDDHHRDGVRSCWRCMWRWHVDRGWISANFRGTVQKRRFEGVYRARNVYFIRHSRRCGSLRIYFHGRTRKRGRTGTRSPISGYHMREAGSTAVQEVAFTLGNGIAYVEAAGASGAGCRQGLRRGSPSSLNAHSNFLEEVAKFRAARRMWAKIMRDQFQGPGIRSRGMLRFHTQTAGSTLTAQQPENNIVAHRDPRRWPAVLGGTQSLHTNSF